MGVIFYVEVLKERIPLQIRVIPEGDGMYLIKKELNANIF